MNINIHETVITYIFVICITILLIKFKRDKFYTLCRDL